MKKRLPSYDQIHWIHQIALPDGRVTPGVWPPRFKEYGLDTIHFIGKRVLDIGCLDGQYTWYAEKRGAKEVISIDINEEQFGKQTHDRTDWKNGYLCAHKAFKSKAKYFFPFSVYDLTKKKFGMFDIVLYLGVHYHLTNPVLALQRISEVLKLCGLVIIDSEVSPTTTKFYHQTTHKDLKTSSIELDSNSTTNPLKMITRAIKASLLFLTSSEIFLERFRFKRRILLWKFFRHFIEEGSDVYNNDRSVFWVVSRDDMRRMIDFSGFQIIREIDNSLSRSTFVCKKKRSSR